MTSEQQRAGAEPGPGLDLDDLARRFRFFVDVCREQSPLYAALSPRIAEDPVILAIAGSGQDRQPPVNMLFGAVHYLLLGNAAHELAAFYPSVGGTRPPNDAFPVFADFCRRHATRLREVIAPRRVQTNEVGRCGLLLPAFALVFERCGRRPLHLVDAGCSAGMNLNFDRYQYAYTRPGQGTVHVCGPASPARVRTEVREGDVPLPDELPRVAGRVGVDVAPVDVMDDDAVRWLEALVWPDDVERVELVRAAVAIARSAPPRIVPGNAMDVVPKLIAAAPPDVLPCVFHSHATYQMRRAWRAGFDAMLADLGRERDLAHVSLEWLEDDPGPQLHLATCRGGERETVHLADGHHHGRWMRWLGG